MASVTIFRHVQRPMTGLIGVVHRADRNRDIYAAGPPVMLRRVALDLDRAGVPEDGVHIDSISV